MTRALLRIVICVIAGLAMIVGGIWVLSRTLGNVNDVLYSGKSLDYWLEQLGGRNLGASNEALAVVNGQVIPQLVDTLLHDTNDSRLRLVLVGALNGLPGVQIKFIDAAGRRTGAAFALGEFGPAGKAAVPALVQALKTDSNGKVCENAIAALGKIRSNPDVVVPLLVAYLDNDDLNDKAAMALENFGELARPAIPKLRSLLHANDRDAQMAAQGALKIIAPETGRAETNSAP